MRALAQYIMRGRIQASVVAFWQPAHRRAQSGYGQPCYLSKRFAEGTLDFVMGLSATSDCILHQWRQSHDNPGHFGRHGGGFGVIGGVEADTVRSRTLLVLVFMSAAGSVVLNLFFSDSARS